MNFRMLLTGFALALATGASAGNLEDVTPRSDIAPPPRPEQGAYSTTWSGTYLGLTYGRGSGTVEYDDFDAVFDYSDDTDLSIFAGHSWQSGSFVYGGELQVISGRTGIQNPTIGAFPDEKLASTVEWRARAGYAFDRTLPFGFVGYGRSSFTDIFGPQDSSGLTYGVGVDYAVTDNIFAGFELSRREMTGQTSNPDQVRTNTIEAMSLRLGYKF